MRPQVLVTKPLGNKCLAALEAAYTVHSLVGNEDPQVVLARVAKDITAVAGGKVSAHLMQQLPSLEIIANSGVGVDSIDLDAARSRNIRVTNTPDVLNDAVAELTLALMLALGRRVVDADRFVREGRWKSGLFPPTTQLAGSKLGMLGLGRIGKEIAARATCMKMDVCYFSRNPQPDQPYEYYDNLVDMAKAVDWIVVILPGGSATQGIVSREVMEALGPHGYLVNVGRGGMVDEEALIDLLTDGRLGGAALDVFADEPNIDGDLLKLDNLVVSPHQGSRTRQTREAMEDLMMANLHAHFAGQPLPAPII